MTNEELKTAEREMREFEDDERTRRELEAAARIHRGKRATGFYWVCATVKYGGKHNQPKWYVAEWERDEDDDPNSDGTWYLPGDDCPYNDGDLTEIDERRLIRD